ncbi:dephospho-CoA kinase [Candidatus Rariloculus sp.]|uniref:dephospho-CoA kinase n=1 Tax=Candidatus Rariloculus sp. TaxID=3101265 RepID=UPI003D0E3E63
MFVRLGAALVDTDAVARDVVARGEPALDEVHRAFGDVVIDDRGELDRRALREIIFSDAERRRELEAILHPRIRERTLTLLDIAEGAYVIAAVPLLVETNFAELVTRVLMVDCPADMQLERLMQRDQIDRTAAEAAIGAQADRAARLATADNIIDNSGCRASTRRQVEDLHVRYLDLASDRRARQGRAE